MRLPVKLSISLTVAWQPDGHDACHASIMAHAKPIQHDFMPNHANHATHDPKIQAKSLNGRKIGMMAPILTIFGPNRSQRRNLFFEKFSNERRRHHGIVVVVIVAVVVAVVAVVAVVVGRFGVACIKGTSLPSEG